MTLLHPSVIGWVLAGAACLAVGRHVGAGAGRGVRRWPLCGGLAIAFISTVGPIDSAGEERSLAVHVVQHMVLFSFAPALLLAAVVPLLRERSVPPTRTSQAGWFLAVGTVVVWAVHLPVVMDATLGSSVLNDASHLALLGAGLLLVWPIAGPSPLAGMSAVVYLAVAELAIGVLGIALTWAPELLYAGYGSGPALWGLGRDVDQMLAGAALLAIEEPVLAIELVVVFIVALGDGEDSE